MWLKGWACYLLMLLSGWLSGAFMALAWAFAGLARAARRWGRL